MRIFHSLKQCSKSSVSSYRTCSAFSFTASTDTNLDPFTAYVTLGNRYKSHGARSGESVSNGGQSNTWMLYLAKILKTVNAK